MAEGSREPDEPTYDIRRRRVRFRFRGRGLVLSLFARGDDRQPLVGITAGSME